MSTDRLADLALRYHKTEEGEYGCPGLSCPGVQRLIKLLRDAQSGGPGVAPTISAVLPAEASDQAIAQAVRATPQGQVVAVAPPDQNSGQATRHGGNCGTTPFYLHHGQRTPEYDQGDAVIVWYDDLYDLAQQALRAVAQPQEPTVD